MHPFHAAPLPDLPVHTDTSLPTDREVRDRLRLANRLVHALRSVIVAEASNNGGLGCKHAHRVWLDSAEDLMRWEKTQ